MEIASKYDPSQVEEKWYKYWLDHDLFKSRPDHREPYTIVIPPPNVTGVLHMGHMLNNTIQDILVRRARMMGKNALWVPGTDHASIATEARVVAKLNAQGIKKEDLTRDEFLRYAWDWTNTHGGIILEQLKRLGASCDWSRTAFTMDEARSKSVIKVFCDLYKKGLIYRGIRMVNWDPKALTAVSDEEVYHKEEVNKLYYIRYREASSGHPEGGSVLIATTRPETILGDTAVCINPNDPRYAHLKGKKVIVPVCNRVVPIIEDEYVDIEFGTGCLKVTPAHDVNDYMLGEKYHLESIDIFNDDGTLNHHGLHYEGIDRFEVRRLIENELKEKGLLEKVEPYVNQVGFSERTHVPIEPKLSTQWFLKMDELAKPALEAVMDDTIRFHPAKFKNMYRHWMENVKDWCISRQLWWGHRIPAYYLPDGRFVVAPTKEEALRQLTIDNGQWTMDNEGMISDNCQLSIVNCQLRQDDDCLDTWFSSWLWPISVFDGINDPDNEDIRYYYPTNDLVTAPEIIFFWVARMIISGYEYRNDACFRNVYFTGIVRDKLGRKMSKSLGNSPDPIELMERYGADGVRMGMLLTSPAGNDLLFDEVLCEQGRNFNNKIWNAFRLVKGWEVDASIPHPQASAIAIRWFRYRMNATLTEMDDCFDKYRLNEALMAVYKLFWDEFSSWYLEIVKPGFEQPIDQQTYDATLAFFDSLLRLLHPFMPFITEELWQALTPRKAGESIMVAPMPRPFDESNRHPEAGACLQAFETVKTLIGQIRTIRVQKNIPPKDPMTLHVLGRHDGSFDPVIQKMGNINPIDHVTGKAPGSVSFLIHTTEYAIPIQSHIDVEAEKVRIEVDIHYLKGLLVSINQKLDNPGFIANAKQEVIANEQKKKSDTEEKIRTLAENLNQLKTKS
ncbi:MAG: valine--tRNA ligase [Tannerella sp.]|jgi:valyl-tRNA synthetase|nr:valine--tRNA ligase [Tannerella sp.]